MITKQTDEMIGIMAVYEPKLPIKLQVDKLAAAYFNKFNRQPNALSVHIDLFMEVSKEINYLSVRGRVCMPKNVLWVGEAA